MTKQTPFFRQPEYDKDNKDTHGSMDLIPTVDSLDPSGSNLK